MKAIILAAGRGTRLYPITLTKPKGLLKVGEETILDRQVRQFRKNDIDDILIVVGYQKEVLMNHFGNAVRYISYEDYLTTNNLHTLWSIRNELNEDVIISFADLIVDNSIILRLSESESNITMAIDTSQVLEGTMRVSLVNDKIKSITSTSFEDADGNFIGIAKFSKTGCNLLINEMSTIIHGHHKDYYTIAVDNLARAGSRVDYLDVKDYIWREIDTKQEYEEACNIYKLLN